MCRLYRNISIHILEGGAHRVKKCCTMYVPLQCTSSRYHSYIQRLHTPTYAYIRLHKIYLVLILIRMESFISVLGKRFSKNLHNVHLVTPRKLSTVRSLMDLKLRVVNYK